MPSNIRDLSTQEIDNPLDNVEEVLNANNWNFNRMTDEELVVNVEGSYCNYSLFFIWQEDFEALQFCCQYELKIPEHTQKMTRTILSEINEHLWLGHFELMNKASSPSFRHTCLFRGLKGASINESIEDLVEIAMAQCERHYSVFALLASGKILDEQILSLAMMNTQGRS